MWRECRVERYQRATLCSVDVDDVLWELRIKGGLCTLNFGTLRQFCDEVCSYFLKLREFTTRAVLKIKGETIGHTISHDHRWLEEEDLRVFEGFLRFEQQVDEHHFGTLCNGVSLFPRFESNEERTIRGALTTHHGET